MDDIITADGALAGAVSERCGPSRTRTSRRDYYKRRDDVMTWADVLKSLNDITADIHNLTAMIKRINE